MTVKVRALACICSVIYCANVAPRAVGTVVPPGLPGGSTTAVPLLGSATGVCPGSPGPNASIQIGVFDVVLRLVTWRLLPCQLLTLRLGCRAPAGAVRLTGGLPPERS